MKSNELFERFAGNPILTASQWPYPINTVFNPGATILPDGTTLLLCRVEEMSGASHLTAARSINGVDGWEVDKSPTFYPEPVDFPEEAWGVEDPRITFVPELKAFAIAYTAYSNEGPGVALATTTDFRQFKRLGLVMSPDNKDATLLPRRINGMWALIHRPGTAYGRHIKVSYSPDLIHWGRHLIALDAQAGGLWDGERIGLGSPPIETPEGWLMIYHGTRETTSGSIYRLGLALFELEDPTKCLLRGNSWIFGPQTDYERGGDVPNVVFPCGHTIAPDGDTIRLYYGAADSCIAMATASLKTLMAWLKTNGEPPEEASSKG